MDARSSSLSSSRVIVLRVSIAPISIGTYALGYRVYYLGDLGYSYRSALPISLLRM